VGDAGATWTSCGEEGAPRLRRCGEFISASPMQTLISALSVLQKSRGEAHWRGVGVGRSIGQISNIDIFLRRKSNTVLHRALQYIEGHDPPTITRHGGESNYGSSALVV
jgi:hypothetical protein